MKVFVLVFENVDDFEVYTCEPRAFNSKEKAEETLLNAFEQANDDLPKEYIRECSEGEYLIYEDGRYSENRWVGRIFEVEIE